MTVKQWLMRYQNADKKIESLLRERQETYERLVSITSQLNGDTVSGSKDPHKFDELAEIDSYIRQEVKKSIAIKTEITTAINELEDWRYRDVLSYRYINNYIWDSIADSMSYTRQHVTRLHGYALIAIKPIIEERCACMLQ